MSRQYHCTRVRGFAPWKPQRPTKELLAQVNRILKEYEQHLPLTIRQIFYRLVGKYEYPKTETAYSRVGEVLNRARRAGVVPFEAIRDDGISVRRPLSFNGKTDFWNVVQGRAKGYRRNRQEGQPQFLEIWVEAAGMAPQIGRIAEKYTVPVYSSGGFDSLTTKYESAKRITGREQQTVVLHIGDMDPSGLSIFDSAAEDVSALVQGMGAPPPRFERVAITGEQVEKYGLPTKPAKKTDRRGDWKGGTVQGEALDPAILATVTENTLKRWMDASALNRLMAEEERDRRELITETEVVE